MEKLKELNDLWRKRFDVKRVALLKRNRKTWCTLKLCSP